MNLLHGTWVPHDGAEFNNRGKFVVWLETTGDGADLPPGIHPTHLTTDKASDTEIILDKVVNGLFATGARADNAIFYACLPSEADRPLPSIEIAQLTGEFLPDNCKWRTWGIRGLHITDPLPFLRDLRIVVAGYGQSDLRLSAYLKFWMQYAQQLRNLIRQHQFLPMMKCHQLTARKSSLSIHTGWLPAGELYERGLKEFTACMPEICGAVSHKKPKKHNFAKTEPLSGIDILRNFSEQQIDDLVSSTAFTMQTLHHMKSCWLVNALGTKSIRDSRDSDNAYDLTLQDWKHWRMWQKEIVGRSHESGENSFVFGIRLDHAEKARDGEWRLSFFVASSQDPSLRVDLKHWWTMSEAKRTRWLKHFGLQFEHYLLVTMGHAARVCPLLWQGMESEHPSGVDIDLATAYAFLKDDALVLESAGFRILLPSWWTPQGRRRARIRINASSRPRASQATQSNGYFDLPSLVQYRYELSVGGEPVSEQEWRELVHAKSPLVRFRGEWMEIDSTQMSRMLELWQTQEQTDDSVTFGEMLRQMGEADDDTTEFVFDEVLGSTLEALQQQAGVEPLDDPAGLKGELRPYQKHGLSWLVTQEALGLSPCLADDMGLGKTIQVIALLIHERETFHSSNGSKENSMLPTLLIAPTSVLGNWRKEVEKFAPGLKCMIHHGAERHRNAPAFADASSTADIVITSFALANKDRAALKQTAWRRIVVDEAQNIKNPKTAQARAICSFTAPLRMVLTGTPVENRLTDLWSLFHFLNPGYLGTAAQFKRAYETPVQRDSDHGRLKQLQQLVRPFILRRLKTDKSVIADLPDKLEQKVYCNLTKEQASLYQAVVDDVQKQLDEAEGMERRGLILATLMKLKQVCNHPAQFLQDSSAFSEVRSHKLARLTEMIGEALDESDSMLVFTQFTEVGTRLETLLRNSFRCPVYYLHGGTGRKRREQMIESFQTPDTPAGIFVLSLKAGGVGITLTQANHVFHFDRWWNPAVENQATDRAYRIGQEKTVFAHKMVTLGTLEERIDKMIEDKQALANSIVGTDENWLTELDNAAFQELIQLNREAIMEA